MPTPNSHNREGDRPEARGQSEGGRGAARRGLAPSLMVDVPP